jgi:hypothetical protein
MAYDRFLQETFFDRIKNRVKRFFRYFPVWKDLLFLSFIIITYLTIRHFTDARFITTKPVYTNRSMIETVWSPSAGEVDSYLVEIRDTRFFPGSRKRNAITMIKNVKAPQPNYQLTCEHNHSYTLAITARSPAGISSPPSEKSTLLICDQQSPRIVLEPLPSPAKLRYPSILITGTFEEQNLESITINGEFVRINFMRKTFSARMNLDRGSNYLTLLAKDLAGNTTTKNIQLDYSPVHIMSIPAGAKIYWNGNYAYLGIYSDTTPQSFNQAIEGKQVLRLTYPGFNDYYGTIDFSDLTTDTYTITLTPYSGHDFAQMSGIKANDDEITIDHCAYPFVVDYDMDGKKDLLTGTKEGTIALFINTNTDTMPAFSDYTLLKAADNAIDVGTHAAPFIVDYNNDGAKDLLVGNGDGSLIYYANKGSNTRPVFETPLFLTDNEGTDIRRDSYCAPCVVDYNEDYKKDLLLGSGDGTLSLYLNKGTDRDPLFSPPLVVEVDGAPLDVGSFAAPFVADWNGDGKKDILIGDGDGYIHVYLDVSTTREPRLISSGVVKLSNQDLTVDEGSSVPFVLDWNNDGKKDLIVGSIQGYFFLFTH